MPEPADPAEPSNPGDVVTSAAPAAREVDEDRRAFLQKVGIGVVGAGVAGVVVVPGAAAFTYPLRAEIISKPDAYIPVGRDSRFGEVPVRVDLHRDQVDAWARTPDVRIGSCWVVEREGELIALSTVCPHLGCSVDYDPEAARFKCPCHRSAFTLDGAREEGPSPRGLDTLELRRRADGLVSIRYQRFKQGVATKEPA